MFAKRALQSLLLLCPAASASEPVSVAGVVVKGAERPGGFQVGVYVAEGRVGRVAGGPTSQSGVYHVITNRLVNIDTIYITSDDDDYPGFKPVSLAQGAVEAGVRKITAPDLVLRGPQASYDLDAASARILAIAATQRLKALAGEVDEKAANAKVTATAAAVAALTSVPETRTVTELVQVPKQEQYTYTAMESVTEAVTQQVTEYRSVGRQIPYAYTELVPVPKTEVRVLTEWAWEPHTFTEYVPMCVRRPVCAVGSPRWRAWTSWQARLELVPVQRTLLLPVPRSREVTETKTEYQEVTRTATRTVQEMIPETRSIAVPVVRMVSVTKTATRTVLVAVPQTREVPTGKQRPAELAELLKAIDARWDTALPKPAVLADKEEFLKLRGHPSYRPQVPSPVR